MPRQTPSSQSAAAGTAAGAGRCQRLLDSCIARVAGPATAASPLQAHRGPGGAGRRGGGGLLAMTDATADGLLGQKNLAP